MAPSARVILHSTTPWGTPLMTMQLRYPKFIHGEFMTHRLFSRNASSSRAIPVERLIQDVLDDPAMPVKWGKNQPGMQAKEELSPTEIEMMKSLWLTARDDAVSNARYMLKCGAHKQIINRIIEPFCHINVVVTATEWLNFFELRVHEMADPTMFALAKAMNDAWASASTPTCIDDGEWHLPYITEEDREQCPDPLVLRRISAARCARTSTLLHDGKPTTHAKDLALFETLASSVPMHSSPMEHQATPVQDYHEETWWPTGNFRDWKQHLRFLQEDYNASF